MGKESLWSVVFPDDLNHSIKIIIGHCCSGRQTQTAVEEIFRDRAAYYPRFVALFSSLSFFILDFWDSGIKNRLKMHRFPYRFCLDVFSFQRWPHRFAVAAERRGCGQHHRQPLTEKWFDRESVKKSRLNPFPQLTDFRFDLKSVRGSLVRFTEVVKQNQPLPESAIHL